MGNLLVSLRNAAAAMGVFERGMSVVQSNVANASTPGYARQKQILEAMRFDLDRGLPGGVSSGGTLDSRSQFLESSVRQRLAYLGSADESTQHLERLEPVFDIREGSGIGGALNRFFEAFATLSVTPNDMAARQMALDRAAALARSFNSTAEGIASVKAGADQSIAGQVDKINEIARRIADINLQFRTDFRAQEDAGLEASLHSALEELSEVADFTLLRAEDGSATIYLGGQSLLTIGERLYPIGADTNGSEAVIVDHEGNDITAMFTGGRLKAAIDFRNTVLPAHESALNQLAQAVADRVNATLAGGVDLHGNQPAVSLFSLDATLGAARTLAVNPLTPDQLALASPAAPGGNAVALDMAELGRAKTIAGTSFAQYYGGIAAGVGRDLVSSREARGTQESLVAQARQLREDAQKVNLDEEAVLLMEYQRCYQAASKMVHTLNEMTETVLNLIR